MKLIMLSSINEISVISSLTYHIILKNAIICKRYGQLGQENKPDFKIIEHCHMPKQNYGHILEANI